MIMKKIVKPHKARKPQASTGVPSFVHGKDQILKSPARLQRRKKNELGEFDNGKDNFKNLKEAQQYIARNDLSNAGIYVGNESIPMDRREYQVTLPNVTITDDGIHKDVEEKRLNDLISHSEIHPITGKPQVIGLKSVYPEFDIITLGQQVPWKNIGNALRSRLQYLNSNLYSDNPIVNAYATLARRYNLPDKARLPYLIRRVKSNELDVDDAGNVILNGGRFSHTNFTYDRPVVSHSKGAWDNAQQTFLINPRKIVANNKFGSIEPSDMFTIKDPEGGLVVSPKDIINITANPTSRRLSKKYGIKTISSDELKSQELKALKQDHDANVQNFGKRFKLAKGSRTEINRDYWNAVHDLQKIYGKPKIKDVQLLENLTGLKSGISDVSDLQKFKNISRDDILDTPISEINQVIDNLPKFGNGRRFNWENYNDQNGITFPYTNFFYDPATPAESLFKFESGKDNHKYYDYIITQSMLGNPTAKRMTGEDDRYIPAFGQGDRSNLVIGSYGDYVTPSVMNVGGELMYVPNPWKVFPEWMVHNQSFRFNNPNDAIDFAENYKYSSPAFPEFFGVDNSVNYNKGKDSGIHIKKKNIGKFTALKKRTGKSASWFKEHGTPAQKKMAVFALNARKWKH